MTAPTRRAPSPSVRERGSPGRPDGWLSHLSGPAAMVLAGLIVGAFFLGLYLYRGYSMPIGWDTARYLSETNLVAERGLAGVRTLDPPPTDVLAGRVGFSVLALTMSSLSTLSTFKLATVIPVAAAVALALAAGVLVSAARRGGPWEAAAVAVAVGVSPTAIRLMAPETYTENLVALACLVAALVLLVGAQPDLRGMAAAVVLMVGGGLSHGATFGVVAAAMAFAALWYLRASWRAWRGGTSGVLATPSGFIAATGGGAAAVLGLGLFGLLGTGPDRFRQGLGRLLTKFRADVPLYRFPLMVPVAAVGVVSLLAERAADGEAVGGESSGPGWPRARLAVVLLLGWTLVVLPGVVLLLLGRAAPAHRLLALLVPLPILVGAGVVAAGRLVSRKSHPALGVTVALVALVGLVGLGLRLHYGHLPDERVVLWMDEGKVREAATAASYLDEMGVPRSAPVVFLVDDRGPQPADFTPLMARIIRSVLAAERIEHAYLYVGDPARFEQGMPTLRPAPGSYEFNSLRFFDAVEPLLDDRPVALILSSFNPAFGAFVEERPDRLAAPGVAVVQGPVPERPLETAPISSAPRGVGRLILVGASIFGLLTLAGLGWGAALFPRRLRLFEALALSPAMGLAVMTVAGVLVDALGLGLTGVTGALTPVAAAASGMALAIPRLRRHGTALFPAR